jgi:hypothetical protein
MISFESKAIIFKDPELQKKFNEEGFVILDFLHSDELAHMKKLFDGLHPDGVTGFYTSTFAKDTDYRKVVDEEIQQTMRRGLEDYFFDYKVYCGSFIAKAPGVKSELILHQDMTLVDETVYTGTNIWIPLIDLDEKNGAIEILPRSHRIFKTYRGSSLPDIYDGIEKSVRSLMKPCYLKAGQAIIFDQSIIHYSPPNLSEQVRPVINTFVTHKDASIRICYWDRKRVNEIEVFNQEEDFMVNFQNFGHDIFNRPSIGVSAGYVPYEFPKITTKILQDEYGFIPPVEENKKSTQPGFFQRLFSKKEKI